MYRVLGRLTGIISDQIWPYTIPKEGWKIKLSLNTNGLLYKTIFQHILKQTVQKNCVTTHLLCPAPYKAEQVYQFKVPDILGLFGKKKKDCGKKKADKVIKKQECKKKKKKACKTDLKKPCLKRKTTKEHCRKEEKKKEPSIKVEQKKEPCKKEEKKKDPCKKKESHSEKKEDPCKKKESHCEKKEDPCKKKESHCEKKEDPCKKKESHSEKKKDPCKKKESHSEKKKDPCKKKECHSQKKEDPCKKKESHSEKKEDPCKKKECHSEKKEDPCKNKEKKSSCEEKKDPCKKKESPSEKKDDPCKNKEKKSSCEEKKDPCKKKEKENSCEEKKDPCKSSCEEKKDPCKSSCEEKKDPCKKKEKGNSCEEKKDPCKSTCSEMVPTETVLGKISAVLGLILPPSVFSLQTVFSAKEGTKLIKQPDKTQEPSSSVITEHVMLFSSNDRNHDDEDPAARDEDCKKHLIDQEEFKDKIKIPCPKTRTCVNPQNLQTCIDDAYLKNRRLPFKHRTQRCYIHELKRKANSSVPTDPCSNNKLFLNDLLAGFVKNIETGFRINVIPKATVGIYNNDGGNCFQLNNKNNAFVFFSDNEVGDEYSGDPEKRLADCKDDTIENEARKNNIKMPCPIPRPCIIGDVSPIDEAFLKENKRRFPFEDETKRCYVDDLREIANNTHADDPCANKRLFLNNL